MNNLSVNMYENQITAVLGRNGAGKTTTIFMLTGTTIRNSLMEAIISVFTYACLGEKIMENIRPAHLADVTAYKLRH